MRGEVANQPCRLVPHLLAQLHRREDGRMKMLILRGKAGYMRTGTGRERGFARATGARLRDAPRL